MLKLSLCNELMAKEGISFAEQCEIASQLGYCGLEIAPATLGAQPHLLPKSERAQILQTVQDHGLTITGLHWLLSAYPNLSITDKSKQDETQRILLDLTELCADLGGKIMVHGSPKQREIPPQTSPAESFGNIIDFFKPIAKYAEQRQIIYCIEPLSPTETSMVTSVAQGAQIVKSIGSTHFKTMIDTSAAGQSEVDSVSKLIRKWVPTGLIGHIHLNDTNRGAPGTGNDPFHEIISAVKAVNWTAPMGVEPFEIRYNALATAAIGKATIDAHNIGRSL